MIEHESAFYDTYCFIFDQPFDLWKKHSLFGGLIAGEPWAWRVVGITEMALKALAEHDFKYTKGLICRAHFVDRIKTTSDIFSKKVRREEFLERLLKTDVTAIALKSENTSGGPPEYISIDPELKLFTSKLVGFKHGPIEREYLRELYAAYNAGKVTPTKRSG